MSSPDTDHEQDAALLARARAAYLDAPAAAPPSGLVEAAMRTVSLELRPARRIPLGGGGADGSAGFVTDVAVVNAVRFVLDGDPAVMARRCRVESADAQGVRIWLSVAVSYAHYDRHGDRAVRSRVVTAVGELFGLSVRAVDIDVVDVFTVRPGVDA